MESALDHRVNDIMTASMVALPDGQRRVFRRLRNVETILSVKDGLDPGNVAIRTEQAGDLSRKHGYPR